MLVLLRRYDEAARLAQVDQPATGPEWVSLHILACIRLKQGRFDEADKLFAQGTQCPWVDVRSRCISSRALLRVKTKRLREAHEMLRSEKSLEAKVIQIDIFRRLKRIGEAKSMIRDLRDCGVTKIIEFSRLLEENMKPGPRTVTDDEFFDREFELVLSAAA